MHEELENSLQDQRIIIIFTRREELGITTSRPVGPSVGNVEGISWMTVLVVKDGSYLLIGRDDIIIQSLEGLTLFAIN